ncbi:MAG: DUF6502 family protein [Woeseiaceae bacterium]
MGKNVKEHLGLAMRVMLKPVIRLLVSQGVTHGDFSEAAKDVYVDVAISEFDKETKLNQSRIAILTGLTRKEVKNVIDRAMKAAPIDKNYSRPGRVLSGWHSDPRYIGPYGVPLELPYESGIEEIPTFTSLVRTYSGDMAPKQMLMELVRIGAVVELENATYKAVRREFVPDALSPELLERLGKIGRYFFSTVATNIEKKDVDDGYFDRRVYAEIGLAPDSVVEFDQLIKAKGQAFLEDIDNWFVGKEKVDKDHPNKKQTGLLMVHYVVDEDEPSGLRDVLVERGLELSGESEE